MTAPIEKVGRYHVERLIAHGGMGSLYLARDPVIDRAVVIKFLKEGFDDDAARERFAREARAAGRLHHPNIVTIFDVGQHQDRPFIAMEYVTGETLAQLIGRRAVRRLWEKLEILEELCAGLHYAHSAAIVHRDIKPSNVMRDQSGVVKILDFGIARGAGGAVTRPGDVVGTLNYMSPEQLAGEEVDHRTDIYAVGVLAYELITGQMAFPGTIQTGVLFRILNSRPLPIDALMPGIDPDIPTIIDRAVARDPAARYPDLDTLRQDLAAVRARLFETDSGVDDADALDPNAETRFVSPRLTSGIRSPSSASRAGSTRGSSVRAITPQSSSARPGPPPRRFRTLRLLGGVGAALVAMVALWMFNGFTPVGPGDPPASSTPSESLVGKPWEVGTRRGTEEPLAAARESARKHSAAGQHELALDTLIGGLALDSEDAELNRILDDITVNAQRTMRDARAAAVVRGATAKSSASFREGQARETEVEGWLRAGGRVPGARAAWAAAALYNRSPEAAGPPGTGQGAAGPRTAAAQQAAPRTPPTGATNDRTSPDPGRSVPTAPSAESLAALPGRVNTAPGVPLPPAAPTPEAPPVLRNPPADPRAAEQAAIRETLRRYMQAYEGLDSAAVGRMMPSLTPDQLRDLQRDFANYRRYTVQIRDERVNVDGQTATVACQVVRSFETKTGVEGNHTVQSIFHLRRGASDWIIERLESR